MRSLLVVSSPMPSLSTWPNSFQKVAYLSFCSCSSELASSSSMPSTRLVEPSRITLHVARLLQDLARDVQRQVVRVDHALDEAQVGRHQLLGVVHDEHALDVQLDAAALVAVPQVERRVRRHVQQLGVFAAALDAVVGVGQRRLEVVRDVLVELVVLLLGDVGLGAGPQRAGLVDGLEFVLDARFPSSPRPTLPSASGSAARCGRSTCG